MGRCMVHTSDPDLGSQSCSGCSGRHYVTNERVILRILQGDVPAFLKTASDMMVKVKERCALTVLNDD